MDDCVREDDRRKFNPDGINKVYVLPGLQSHIGTNGYSIASLRDWLVRLFVAAGLRETDAGNIAENLAEAERRGVRSHGLLLVPLYLHRIAAGGIDPASQPQIVFSSGCLVAVDGKGGVGQSAAFLGAFAAVDIAREHGIGLANIQNNNHIGMLASYALAITARGLACIILTNAGPSMAAHGGRSAAIGNNAICFGFPGSSDPLIVDMAVGTVACGKIRAAAVNGSPAGEDWLLDRDGTPTTDPSALDQGGSVLPFAAHKGYAIAVAVDAITGLLGGGVASPKVLRQRQAPNLAQFTSQTVIAIDPSALGDPHVFRMQVGQFVELLRTLPVRKGFERVLAPGDPEIESARKADSEGIAIPPALISDLRALSLELGVAPIF